MITLAPTVVHNGYVTSGVGIAWGKREMEMPAAVLRVLALVLVRLDRGVLLSGDNDNNNKTIIIIIMSQSEGRRSEGVVQGVVVVVVVVVVDHSLERLGVVAGVSVESGVKG